MKTSLQLISVSTDSRKKHITEIDPIYEKTKGIIISALFLIFILISVKPFAQGTYSMETGTLGTTYSWIDCSSGTAISNGDDVSSSFPWPFDFNFYGTNYTTADDISVSSNGFIRLDGSATTSYYTARDYDLTSTATNLGQIIGVAIYDGDPRNGYIKYLTTGTAPNRVLTIEFYKYEVDYNDYKYCYAQASLYETTNKVVLKLGTDNLTKSGVDMGIHSGVSGYFHKWQEVLSGTNNTWIEYSAPILVNASIGSNIGFYSDLKSAFDAINDGTHKGDITIKIQESTTETASAVLNASGDGSSNYNNINIYPVTSGLSISGNFSNPLIDLSGADNVILDGRVNAGGSLLDLQLINESSSSATATSVIRFINDATNNTVKYCTIKGSQSLSNSGIVYFATTTETQGNDNNTISNNSITSYNSATRPVNVIYSNGTTGKDNSDNIIKDNSIFDFFKQASASSGVYLYSNSTDWTIDGNSFYETASFSSTGTVTYIPIKINNTSGNNFEIVNNWIGGSAPECDGSPWTKSNSRSNVFYAIYVNVGNATASSIQNNTIKNFSWNNSSSSSWSGIYIANGDVNVGNITGNTIGETTGTASIDLSNSSLTSNSISYGIYVKSDGSVNILNNSIGSIRTTSSGSISYSFYGIYKTYNKLGNLVIKDNLIGSLTTANSIQAATVNVNSSAQNVNGIRSDATGNTLIHGNTISNLFCAHEYATANNGQVVGVYTNNGVNEISNNTIKSLSSSSPSADSYNNAAVIGIMQKSTTAGQSVIGNSITNLHSTYTGTRAIKVTGIYYYGGINGINTISGNYINNLTLSSTSPYSSPSIITGIKIRAGANLISNNVISLGQGNTTIQAITGIYENGNSGHNNNVIFNTVYIGGSTSGNFASSYALYSVTSSNSRDIRNNIFSNIRSGGSSGNHYAIRISGTTSLVIDNNDYFVSGTGGIIGKISNTNKTDLANWVAGTSQDASSVDIDPVFLSAGGTLAENYKSSISLIAAAGTGVTLDYEGVTRNSTPKIGAFETTTDFIWTGASSTDFATTSNWQGGFVPPNGASISFANSAINNCLLDQNRELRNITNIYSKKLDLNGNQLTLTGNIISSTNNQIDASVSTSAITFKGNAAQTIPTNVFVNNTIGLLTLDNSHGLVQNGDIIISSAYTLSAGTYTIGANTLTLNGIISSTTGILLGGSSSNIVIGGSGVASLPSISLNNLTLDRSVGISLAGSVDVAGDLTLTSGTLTVGANTLTLSGNSPSITSGNIDASNASATLVFDNPSAITLPSSLFSTNVNNLTINGGGLTAGSNFTIDGILNMITSNPSSIKGLLDMSTYTLSMGSSSSTIGNGDISGIIKREHTFTTNTQYTFGNEHTSVTFIDANLKPNWISLNVELGTTPTWTPWTPSPDGKVKRVYKIASSNNSSTAQAVINMRYLTSEIDASFNDESKLIFWHKFTTYNSGIPHEHGKSSQDLNNHYLSVTGLVLGSATTTNIDDSQIGIAYSVSTKNTWKGEVLGYETIWENAGNWTAGTVPTSTDDVLIPTGLSNYPSLTALSNAEVGTIEISSGASITANSYELVVSGSGGAWINNGTFNAGTGNVKFDHGVPTEIVTVSGATSFYNLEIYSNTTIQPVSGCYVSIAGAGIGYSTSLVDFSIINNTVEWNGANQSIINPTGGYYNLIISGSGTKTMPITALSIQDEFIIKGTASVTAGESISVGGELEIYAGATFATGNHDHIIGGDFDNSGTFTVATGTKITLDGTASQSIYGSSNTIFEKLTIDNTAGVSVLNDLEINNELALTNGTLNNSSAQVTLNGEVSRTSGNFNFNNQASLIMGGTIAQNFTSSFFAVDPSFNNLTINRTGGVIIAKNTSVSGILNIQSANPSATIGALDMSTYTLSMGAGATTIGDGDLTGIVKRTTILPNIAYTFGHKNTNVTFSNYGTLPTEISVKIEIGTAPSWRTSSVERVYGLIQSGASGTLGVIKGHYLDSELNGNAEQSLIDLTNDPVNGVTEKGRSNFSTTDNWVSLDNANFGIVPPNFGLLELSFGVSATNEITWDGSFDTDWYNSTNWTPALQPNSSLKVVIPNATTTANDPTISDTTTIISLNIQSGGILNGGGTSQLTIIGAGGALINNGTFNPSTGRVTFNHGDLSEIVTVAGSTSFNNLEISANTIVQPVPGCSIQISGYGLGYPTTVVDFSSINSTVEWNGGNQTIIDPVGLGGHGGYFNLIISGSGTKVMPADAMYIAGDLTISGTTSATAADSIIVNGDINIVSGSTFGTGSNVVQLSGDFDNQGTFNAASGGELYLLGNGSSQNISGSSAVTFDNIRHCNPDGVSYSTDIIANNKFSLCDGQIDVNDNTLSINGTIYNPAGNLILGSTSNLTFGGSSAITIVNDLFGGTTSLNNLTINCADGVTLGNEDITVNGTLNLIDGTLSIGANTLTIDGNAPTITSGNIDASNASANMAFSNSSSITLPASLFTGNINNLKINGIGGVISNNDLSVNGILNLDANNPSTSTGVLHMNSSTLDMGVDATTVGSGDVSGIIRRQHTFTNDVDYSFGNEFTTINFIGVSGGVKPAWLSCKVELGSSPVWRTTNVKRVYSFAQEASGTDRTYTKLHYSDFELDDSETSETILSVWNDYDGLATGSNTFVNGKTTNSTTENWVELIGMATDFIAPSTTFAKQYGIGYSDINIITWTGLGSGSYPGDWSLPGHWSGGVPTENDDVLIPGTLPIGSCGYPNINELNSNSPAVAKTVTIETGAQIDATQFDIIVNGDGNAWVNNGTFIAGLKDVTFSNGDPTKTVSVSGNMQFNNVIISDKTKLKPATNSSISISGNLTSEGDISSANANTIIFNGNSGSQTISGSGTMSFYNLTINNTNSSGEVILEKAITVANVLTLTESNITTDGDNSLTLGALATVSGGSATSYIDGPMTKEGTASFDFPVGHNDKYARIGITNPTSAFTAQYYNANNANSASSIESPLTKVSNIEYWNLEPVTAGAVADVTLYFESTVASGITDPTDLRVAHWTGTTWEDLGNGANGANYVTSSIAPSSFSPFTLGTINNVSNPLPVELILFDAVCDNNKVVLKWKTASELNNDKFLVERSNEAEEWSTIANIKGAGNSNTIKSYEFTDFEPNVNTTYYRLKQIDLDGEYSYSEVIISECIIVSSVSINLYPNPAVTDVKLTVSESLIGSKYVISNNVGQNILFGKVEKEQSNINIHELSPGVYILMIKTESGNVYKEKLVVN